MIIEIERAVGDRSHFLDDDFVVFIQQATDHGERPLDLLQNPREMTKHELRAAMRFHRDRWATVETKWHDGISVTTSGPRGQRKVVFSFHDGIIGAVCE